MQEKLKNSELILKVKSLFSNPETISRKKALVTIFCSFIIMLSVGMLLTECLLFLTNTDSGSGTQKVLSIWQQEIEAQPKDFNALIQLALNQASSKDYQRALETLGQAEKVKKSSWEVPYYRGLIYKALGEEKSAKKYLELVIKNYPQHYLAFYELGVINMEEENYPTAAKFFEKAAILSPVGTAELYENLGKCYDLQGMTKKAKMAYEKAFKYQRNAKATK